MKLNAKYYPVLALSLFIILLGLIYAAESNGQVMFDDELEISMVSSFHSVQEAFTVDCFGLFRPVKNLVFYFWQNTWPGNLQAWRLSAILAFLGVIPLAYQFFAIFFQDKPWHRFFAAAIWASAPAMTSVVSWISSTNIILSGYGFFLYFIGYEKTQKMQVRQSLGGTYGWMTIALFGLGFACLAYEAALMGPFLVLLRDFWCKPQRLGRGANRVFYAISIGVLACYLVLRHQHGGANTIDYALAIPSDSKLWLSLSSGWFYLVHAWRWIWPFGQQGISIIFNPEEHKDMVLFSLSVVVSIGLLVLWLGNKRPKLATGLGFFGLALLPMANVLPLRNGPICDYYLFFPSLGLVLTILEFSKNLKSPKLRPIPLIIACIWLGAFVLTTRNWVPHWKTREALAQRTLEWQPDNYVMLAFLAEGSLLSGDMTASRTYLDHALATAPEVRKYRYNIEYLDSLWLGKSGKYEESAKALESIVAHHQESQILVPVLYQLQLAYLYDVYLNQTSRAEACLTKALKAPWDGAFSKPAALRLADIHSRNKKPEVAKEIYQMLAQLYPADAEIQQKLNAVEDASPNSPLHSSNQALASNESEESD
ncbi:MAG: hypothetical protein KJT03_04150 [Verrucomicrobiae bacterium]|nr:hypothetical protein [Verrucomicrobiae bacterium]